MRNHILLVIVLLFANPVESQNLLLAEENSPKAANNKTDQTPEKPNIVLIYCDDLGYGDIGCFGSTKHRTPNIDSLAENGRKFTSFYVSAPVCTPSRSSLMTGCYPRRVNMHQDSRGGWVLFPIAEKGLHPNELTIAEVLKTQDYTTGCVGKWHLGDQPQFLPRKQGFDSYFGIPYSNDMGTKQRRPKKNPPLPLMRNELVFEAPVDQSTLTKRYTEEAVKFITKNKEQPFFLYLPHTFPHVPLYASEKFRNQSRNGKYGDAVEEIDWSTGEIIKTLRKLNLEKKTLVIFTSDNGASSRAGGSNAPLRGFKGTTWEGGMRVCCVMCWPGTIPAGTSTDELTLTMDLMPTIAHLAGTRPPQDRLIDGKNIAPIILGEKGAKSPHEAFFYYRVKQLQAVRSGKWKLHLPRNQRVRNRQEKLPVQLYDLSTDIGESKNMAEDHPEVVKKLMNYVKEAREDLGDNDQSGKNQRKAGHEPNPKPQLLSTASSDSEK